MRAEAAIGGVLAALLGAGAIIAVGRDASPAGATTAVAPKQQTGCAYRQLGALPDARCTPGATNRQVTQRTIGQTICKPGWTTSIRPSQQVTEPQKFGAMRAYGDSTAKGQAGMYEYDHLIPLELGGAPDDPRNMWPELHHVVPPGGGDDLGSLTKDVIEDGLKRDVCAGRIRLAAARREIRTDWTRVTP